MILKPLKYNIKLKYKDKSGLIHEKYTCKSGM